MAILAFSNLHFDIIVPKTKTKQKNEESHLFRVCHYVLIAVDIKAWFPYRICRTKKIRRTDRIHSISYKKLYLLFLLYLAFVREVSINLHLSYEFFSYDRYDRYNDMETRLNDEFIL